MTQKMIHELWAARKLDSKIAKGLMLESRCLGAQRFYMSMAQNEQYMQSTPFAINRMAHRISAKVILQIKY